MKQQRPHPTARRASRRKGIPLTHQQDSRPSGPGRLAAVVPLLHLVAGIVFTLWGLLLLVDGLLPTRISHERITGTTVRHADRKMPARAYAYTERTHYRLGESDRLGFGKTDSLLRRSSLILGRTWSIQPLWPAYAQVEESPQRLTPANSVFYLFPLYPCLLLLSVGHLWRAKLNSTGPWLMALNVVTLVLMWLALR